MYLLYIAIFLKIEETKIPDMHKLAAQVISDFLNRLMFAKSNVIGFILFAFVFSSILTIVSFYVGAELDKYNTEYTVGYERIVKQGYLLPYLLVAVLINSVFDSASFTVTRFHIRKISNANSFLAPIFILVDATFSFFLAIFMLDVICYLSIYLQCLREINIVCEYPGLLNVTDFHLEALPELFKDDRADIMSLPNTNAFMPYTYYAFSFTAFVPTISVLLFLLTLYTTKIFLTLSKGLGLHYLNRAVESPESRFIPFTLIGSLLSVFVSIGKLSIELSKW